MSFTTADYIAQFRRDNNRPEFADWNDEKILQTYIDEFHKTGELARHPALLEYMNDSRFDGTSLVDEVKSGWNRGVDQFQGKLYDTARLAGDLVGSERMSEWGREGYERNKTEAGEEASPIIDRWEDVNDFKSFTYWAANQVAQNAPQLIGTLAAAAGVTAMAPKAAVLGGGGLIARGVGALTGSALRNEAGAFAGLAVNRLAGALAASGVGFAQMQNYGELLDQGGENAKELAVLNGAVGSILEAVTPVMAINKVFGRAGAAALDDVEKEAVQRASESILKRGAAWVVKPAVEAAKEGSTEMLTEMAQEAVSMATEAASMRNDPNFKLEDDVIKSRLLNAGLAGFLLGAASGTGAGVVGESQLRGSKEYIAARAQAEAEEVGSTPQDNLASMKQPESTAPRASLDVSVPPIQAQPQPATEGVPNGLQEKGQKEVAPAVVPAPVAVPTPTAPAAVTPEKPLPLAQVKNRVKAIERELVAIAQADPSIDLTPIQEQLRSVGTDPMKLSQVEAAVPPLADKASQAWAKRALQNIQDQLGKQIGAVREQRQREQTVSANREGREVLKQQDMNAKRQRILEEELAAQAMQQPTVQPAAVVPAAQVAPEVPTPAPAPTPVFRKANEVAWKAEQAEVPKGRDPIKILDGLLPPKRAAKSRSQSRRFAVFSLPDGSVEMREMVPGAKVPTLYPSVDRANKAAPEGRVPGHRGVTKLTVESYFKRLPGAQLLAVYDTKDADVASVYKFANAEEYSSVFGYREAVTEKAAPAAKGWRGVSEDTLTRVFNLMNDNTLGAEDAIMSSAKLKRYFAEAFPNPSQFQGALDRLNSTFYTSQTAEDFAQKVVQSFIQEKGQKASQAPAAKAAVLEESGQVEQVDLPQEPKRKPAKSKTALTVRSTFNPEDTDSYAVRFSTLASDLAKRGLSVVLADARKTMGTDAAGGRYDPSDRTVLLSVQNVVSPSKQSYIALVHEAVHDQIEQLPETVREALHVWIDQAFAANPGMAEQTGWDPRLAQQGGLPEGTKLGSRTNELLVESLAQAGVDRAQATGMLDTLWRTIKHYLTQAAIYLQEKLLGKDYTEGKLAEAFANNLVDRMLAGDGLRGLSGFLSQFGRPNTLGDVLTVSDEHGRLTLDSVFDPATGEVNFARNTEVSGAALAQNVQLGIESLRAALGASGVGYANSVHNFLSKADALPEEAMTVRPLDAAVNKITDAMHSIAANAQIDVAKLNQLDKTYRSLHEWYTRQYPSEKKSYADFVTKVLGVRDPVADRNEALAAADANLQAEFDSKEYSLIDHTFRDGTKFNVDMLLDDMNEIERGRAELETYKSAKKVYDTQVKTLTKEKESLADLNNRIEESRTELTDVTTKLTDVMEHDRRVTNLLRQSIANVQKLYEQQKLVAENRGILADAFVRIMGESAERVQINDRLTHAVESRLAELPMKSILDRLAAIGVTGDASVDEIVTAAANDVAANPGSVLAQIAMRPGETPETTNAILFASIISLIKKNEVEAGLLRLSGTRTGAALAEMEKVREILSAQTEQKLKEIRTALRKGPSYRIASKLIEKRQALLKEIADHAKLTHSTKVREALLPSFKQLVDSLSNRIELVLGEMNVHAGIPVPQPDSTVEQLSDRTKWTKVEFDKGSGRLLTDVPALLKKYNDWIEAHKDRPDVQGGSMFREMRRVAEQLREVMVQTERADLRGGWVSSGYLLGSVSHLMEAVGNQYGALAARLMRLFASGVSQGQLPAYNRGAAVEVAIDRAARALGITVNEFNEFFLSPGKTFFENESFSDWTQAERALREYMVADKVAPGRQSLKNDRVWKAFMQAFKAENEARMFNATRMGESEQTKVRDPEVNGARKLIHRGLATFPRRIRDRVRTTVRELRGLFSGEGELALVKDPKTPGDVARNAKILSENPKLKDIIAPYFYNNRNMMAPLPKNNVFGADRIPTARSSELWLESGGSILDFADRVFGYYFDENAVPSGVEEDGVAEWIESEKNKYRETLVNWTTRELTRLFNMVRSQDGLDENLNIQTINMSALMMDAREANTLPDAMIEYPMHTREFMQAVNHSLNGVKVFGHDYEKLFPLIKAAASEVESEAKEYALLREDPRAMAEMRQKDPKKLERLKEASRLFQLLGDNGKNVVNDIVLSFNPEDRGLRNASLFWTAFDASLSFIMSGPRSGLKQAASILNLAALGRSPTSGVRLAAKGFHNFTQEMLAGAFNSTLGQVLPVRWNPNSRARRLLASSMYGGPMPSGNIVELVAGHHGPRGENDYGVSGKLRKGVRKWNEAFKNAQLGAGDPNAAPLARINPFNWSQLGTNMALYETVFNEWSDLVEKGAWFKLENPDLANKPVDHAMLGVPKNYLYSAVKGEFAKYGLDIDTSVDFAMKKIRGNEKTEFVPQSDAPFLWKYSIDQLSGEASPLTNRPAFTQKSTLTRKLWTLISYPLFQTQRIMDLYRTADGRKTAKSIAQGLSVTALFMLPASLAFSAMLDLYDEEIMGKKQARRPMRPEDFHNNLLGLLERINNAGTGGLFTDLAQGSLGMFDASAGAYNSMSLDRRIVMANQLRAVAKTMSDGLNMGYENWNYANFYRPAMMAAGLGGPLQMVQTSNNLVRKLGIEDGIEAVPLLGELARWESNVTDRTTTNNYIRGAMLAAGYETRAAGGAIGTPSPITPWVTNMQLAALRNDQEAFRKAYEKAVKAAMEIPGETDPIERVRNNFASRHPLKQLPAQALTPGEWARVFGMLDEQGRSAVMSAVGLMNAYGSAIGVKPYFGSTTSQATMRSGLRSEAIRRTGSSRNSSLEDLL